MRIKGNHSRNLLQVKMTFEDTTSRKDILGSRTMGEQEIQRERGSHTGHSSYSSHSGHESHRYRCS